MHHRRSISSKEHLILGEHEHTKLNLHQKTSHAGLVALAPLAITEDLSTSNKSDCTESVELERDSVSRWLVFSAQWCSSSCLSFVATTPKGWTCRRQHSLYPSTMIPHFSYTWFSRLSIAMYIALRFRRRAGQMTGSAVREDLYVSNSISCMSHIVSTSSIEM
jgi:hypothetical protein